MSAQPQFDTRAQLANELRHALIRMHAVQWGFGQHPEPAADALYNSGNAKTDHAYRAMHAAIANGASDAEIGVLARAWHDLAFADCVGILDDCVADGQHVTFPETSTQAT